MKRTLVLEIANAPGESVALVPRVKEGLSVVEFDALRDMFGVTDAELASHLGISIPTLYRRRRNKERLDRDTSDKVVRLARLFGMAREFFDGADRAARGWFERPARALGGVKPLVMAETEVGARLVEQLLGRLEHSVYT